MPIMTRLNSKELRDISLEDAREHSVQLDRNPIYFIIENVYDTFNIGGIFRLADALAVSKVYLCGETETPPNHKIQKASVGTHKIVPWEYRDSAVEAIRELRGIKIQDSRFMNHESKIINPRLNTKIIAIEQSKNSIPYTKADYTMPVALIVGNETFGVSKQVLSEADQIVEIPMWGINKSLNVIVSAAIVGYHVTNRMLDA